LGWVELKPQVQALRKIPNHDYNDLTMSSYPYGLNEQKQNNEVLWFNLSSDWVTVIDSPNLGGD
jgi:hypothetical protein